jgi:hypothetical protein
VTTGQDIDGWSERLAGRGAAGDGGNDGTDELRAAILADERAVAQQGATDRVGLERLMRRLETEGLLEPPARRSTTARRLQPWLAMAATLAALAIGVRLLLPLSGPGAPTGVPSPGEVTRGFAGVVKQSVPDPRVAADAAAADLHAIGLEAREVPADGRVILEVDVPESSLDAFRTWAEPRGGRVLTPGRYRVIFEPEP